MSILSLQAGTDEPFEAGIFLIDKPPGISSFGVVSKLRRIFGIKKVGHAGTLDPIATGLLVLCAGRPATKMISQFMEGDKEYQATLRLGVETSTLDTEGEVVRSRPLGTLSASDIENCLDGFRGLQKQVPPAYSALKHKGKPLYYYARKGIEITKDARDVQIRVLERTGDIVGLSGDQGELGIRVVCSKGTYIRTLGADIGNTLGCGAHLVQLRRTKSGCFSVKGALCWEDLIADDARERCLKNMMSVEQVANLLQ